MRYLVIILSFIGPNLLMGQEPLEDPNEVWVNASSGDTLHIGYETCLQLFFANEYDLDQVIVEFGVSSPDGATWEWLSQPNGEGPWPDEQIVTFVEGNRWEEGINIIGITILPHPPSGGPEEDSVGIGLVSVSDPQMVSGSLEHIISLHLRPTGIGTICIDKICMIPCDGWQFTPPTIDPSWNGPFCFTVAEPLKGDINCDGKGNIGDAVYLINWIFREGPEPCR